MTHDEYLLALEALGWSPTDLARQLLAAGGLAASEARLRDQRKTLSRYANGVRQVPLGLAAYLRLAVANTREGLPCGMAVLKERVEKAERELAEARARELKACKCFERAHERLTVDFRLTFAEQGRTAEWVGAGLEALAR